MEREELETLIDRMLEGDEEARQALLDHIMRQSEGIRVLAMEALRDGGEQTREQLLLTLAHDASLVIGRGRARRRPRPERRLDDDEMEGLHPVAREAAREWTAAHAPSAPPPALLDRLRDPDRFERARAARELGEFDHPDAVAALVELLRGDDKIVAAGAIEGLQAIGPAAEEALIPLLDAPSTQSRWHAAKALSTISGAAAAPALVRRLEDPEYGTRWLAAEGLVHAGRDALVPLLERLVESERPSAWLRGGAWHVLQKIRSGDDEADRRLRALGAEIRRAGGDVAAPARAELNRLQARRR